MLVSLALRAANHVNLFLVALRALIFKSLGRFLSFLNSSSKVIKKEEFRKNI